MKKFYSFLIISFLVPTLAQAMNHNLDLLVAATESDSNLLQHALQNGANINAKDIFGNSALHKAAISGNTTIAEILIQEAITIDIQDGRGYTPLHQAILNNHLEMVKVLVKAGADGNARTNRADTAFGFAVNKGNKAIIEELLKAKTNNNMPTGDLNDVPVHIAAENGQNEIISILIKANSDINAQNKHGNPPLHNAASKGHVATIEFLLNSGAQIEAKNSQSNCSPLCLAMNQIKPNSLEILGCLVSHGASIHRHIAKSPMLELAQKLQLGLISCVKKDNLTQVAKLLNRGAYKTKGAKSFIDNKRQELFQALQKESKRDLETVEMLLKQGFTLNTCDKYGDTLLHKAIIYQNVEATKLLVHLLSKVEKLDSYLNKKNNDGYTPLMLAVAHASQAILPLFRELTSENRENIGTKRKFKEIA